MSATPRKAARKRATQSKANAWIREWLSALLWAGVAALIIRTLLFEAYRIPTPSMERTLMTGDFLIVSKLNYGLRTPMSVGVPFTDIHIRNFELPWARVPGWQDIRRNDIVVFNYPIDETVIAARTSYIKRAVGVPGDTLRIEGKVLHVNGVAEAEQPTFAQMYRVVLRDRIRLSEGKVEAAGGEIYGYDESGYYLNLSPEGRDAVAAWPETAVIEPYVRPATQHDYLTSRFRFANGLPTNQDHLPEFVVPAEGLTIALDSANYAFYEMAIERYEGRSISRAGSTILIDGQPATSYTFTKNYYFMMGDNRDNSEDSRSWGFVPFDHVIGKPVIVYFSLDMKTFLPRFGRIFNLIN